MCGLVGLSLSGDVLKPLICGLKRLEYRGYDSAGVALLNRNQVIECVRAAGKLHNLEEKLTKTPMNSSVLGMGHVRWATHGAPSEDNAHPHSVGNIALVHNGIIENFSPLRDELEHEGCVFTSQTDTEVAAILVHNQLKKGLTPRDAVLQVVARLRGSFSFLFLFGAPYRTRFMAIHCGNPLVFGTTADAMKNLNAITHPFAYGIASDPIAFPENIAYATFLKDHQGLEITDDSVEFFDLSANKSFAPHFIPLHPHRDAFFDKGPYQHFMAKEMAQQPETLTHTLASFIDPTQPSSFREDLNFLNTLQPRRLVFVGCGTSYYACLEAQYWAECLTTLPTNTYVASEFRYSQQPIDPDALYIFLSQSGETIDTLHALRQVKKGGGKAVVLVNNAISSLAREADFVLLMRAGLEIGVAATKSFTAQLAVLLIFLLKLVDVSKNVHESPSTSHLSHAELFSLPRLISEALKQEPQIKEMAKTLLSFSNVLYIGRGSSYPIALEGALKFKELSYRHAQAYPAGELKHGPIATIDSSCALVVLAPNDDVLEKTISNAQEARARGATVFLLTQENIHTKTLAAPQTILAPTCNALLNPFAFAPLVQLLSYHAALWQGTDVDQPRNLAKSVTVE